MVRSLYELFLKDHSLFNLLISQIEAFEKFLHRSKLISVRLKEADLNNLALVKKLTTGIFQKKDKSKLKESLMESINKRQNVVGKKWLTEKVNQL